MSAYESVIFQRRGSLAVRDDQSDWTEEQRAALEQIGVAEAPHGDQLVFLHVSQRMGLDPFNKEIYMIGRWDRELGRKRWTIQIGIDGFRSKSEDNPEYAGIDGPEWCGKDGVWRDVWLLDEPPVAARFTVYRRDWERPVRAVAHYREYVQLKNDNKPTAMWTKAAGQLGKCAEALARRKAFPRKLRGVYLDEELQHLDNPAPKMAIDGGRAEIPASQAEPDWDSLIAEAVAAGDMEAIKDAWTLAQAMRPDDGELATRFADVMIVDALGSRDRQRLHAVWRFAGGLRPNDSALAERIASAGEELKRLIVADAEATDVAEAAPPPEEPTEAAEPMRAPVTMEHLLTKPRRDLEKHLFALLGKGGIKDTKEEGNAKRILVVSRLGTIVPRPVSFKEVSDEKLMEVIVALDTYDCEGRLLEELAQLTQPARET